MKAHITDELADGLKENEVFWDEDDIGFGVRRQRHQVVFIVRYRQNRIRRCFTIGRYGKLSSAEARHQAQLILKSVRTRASDLKPWNIRRSKSACEYFGEVAERYLTEYAKPRKKPESLRADRRNLELHILPKIGNMKLSQINRPIIIKLHASMQDTPVAANRCLALISHILSIAQKWAVAPPGVNPCKYIDRFIEKDRERYLSEEEFVRLGAALEVATKGYATVDWSLYPASHRFVRTSAEDWRALAAIRLLLFTGARMSEILSLRWSWIDWRLGVARLPDSKTGPKMLYLPGPAIELLTMLKERAKAKHSASHFVLPGDRPSTHFQGLFPAWKRIRTVARLEDLRVHDLRHVYASTAVSSGDSLYIVGRILGHRRQATTERYAHLAVNPILHVANRTATTLQTLLTANAGLGGKKR